MKRRDFLRLMGLAGASVFAPSSLNITSMYKRANAAVNYAGTTVAAPAVMPQVINIFLYGGPSELAGNLTNIQDIHDNSQNSYTDAFGAGILQPQGSGGLITPSGFWSGAGGDDMQFLLDQSYMSVYRTIMKRLNGTRSHRESILMSQKGSLDVETSAGIATRIAATMMQHRSAYEAGTSLADGTAIGSLANGVEDLFLPFVSFEGESRLFAPDPDVQIPLLMRGTTLDQNFDNPYTRNNDTNATELDALVNKVMTAEYQSRYSGVVNAFSLRQFLDAKMAALTPGVSVNTGTDSSGDPLPLVTDAADAAAMGIAPGDPLVYPDNNFTDRIRAAVTLAIKNPASLFITVGGGLGGWDDHNNAITDYRDRMNNLFATLKAAMLHIKYSATATTLDGTNRNTVSNIAINMYGEFGRLVNLNGPQGGWDHGNNQNLYTFGIDATDPASPRPANALGKIVGTTTRVGKSGVNNQVLEPAPGSYEAEPMSIAATVYSYFGVQTPASPTANNPSILTADPTFNPAGVPAIDETK